MRNSLIASMRDIIGIPQFYIDGQIDIGLALEYFGALLILVVVVSSIFKILCKWVTR